MNVYNNKKHDIKVAGITPGAEEAILFSGF